MDQRGTVDRRDNRHLDVKQVHQEMLGILIDVVPPVGRHLREVPAHVEFGAVDVAGAGDDDDLVFLVAANLAKGVAELLMCGHAPLEGTTFGMKDGLQDTVAPLHLNVLVPVFVIVEFWHSDSLTVICESISPYGGIRRFNGRSRGGGSRLKRLIPSNQIADLSSGGRPTSKGSPMLRLVIRICQLVLHTSFVC